MADVPAGAAGEVDAAFDADPLTQLLELTGAGPDAPEEAPPAPETPTPSDTPEAEPPADAPQAQDTDDDEEEDAEPETPPAAPDPDAVTPESFADLAKKGTPLTYTVDGVQKTTTDIVELAGRGAVIPPDALNRVRDRLQQADRLGEQNKKLFADAQTQVAAHDEAVSALERQVAQLDAAGTLFLELLNDPERLLMLANDPSQRQFVVREMRVAAQEAEYRARDEREQRRVAAQGASKEAETRQSLMDTHLTQLTDGLPPEDREAAQQFFGPLAHVLFRKATAEDAAKYPGVIREGQEMFDAPRIAAWVEDRKALRAQIVSASATKTEAQRHNAAVSKAPASPPAKPLPPRHPENGQFTKPKTPPAPKAPMSRYERLLAVKAGQEPFGP